MKLTRLPRLRQTAEDVAFLNSGWRLGWWPIALPYHTEFSYWTNLILRGRGR